MAGMAGNGWKWMEMARDGLEWFKGIEKDGKGLNLLELPEID